MVTESKNRFSSESTRDNKNAMWIQFNLNFFSIFQFQEAEKKRYRAEQTRFEMKHRRQLEESRASSQSAIKELEQLQVFTISSYIIG